MLERFKIMAKYLFLCDPRFPYVLVRLPQIEKLGSKLGSDKCGLAFRPIALSSLKVKLACQILGRLHEKSSYTVHFSLEMLWYLDSKASQNLYFSAQKQGLLDRTIHPVTRAFLK